MESTETQKPKKLVSIFNNTEKGYWHTHKGVDYKVKGKSLIAVPEEVATYWLEKFGEITEGDMKRSGFMTAAQATSDFTPSAELIKKKDEELEALKKKLADMEAALVKEAELKKSRK
jgi:hypothetical protein